MRETRWKWCVVAGLGMLLLGGCARQAGESGEDAAAVMQQEDGEDAAAAMQQEDEEDATAVTRQEDGEDATAVTRQEIDAQKEQEKEDGGEADGEAELLRFRQDREDMIHLEGEYIEMGTPNEAEYSLDFSAVQESPRFEFQEMSEAYEAAEIYVTQTLGIQPPTKCGVYMCMDPDMAEIYRDEDKGVAKGYENENIFLSEFCGEDHNWQCLVLVREGKGQPWRVIYCGNDYTEET